MRNTDFYAPSTALLDDDSALLQEIGQIAALPGLAMCGELFNTLYCTFRYPACTADLQWLRPICESQCTVIFDQVQQCLNDLPNIGFQIVREMFLDGISCEESETYYRFPSQYASENPDECLIISKLSLSSVLCMYVYMYLHVCVHKRLCNCDWILISTPPCSREYCIAQNIRYVAALDHNNYNVLNWVKSRPRLD